MIVRILLWSLGDEASLEEVRNRLDALEPLEMPSTWLVNEASERFGVLVVGDDDPGLPPQVDELRALIGRDPDLYEEFDAVG